jgi:hypothetical protein
MLVLRVTVVDAVPPAGTTSVLGERVKNPFGTVLPFGSEIVVENVSVTGAVPILR